MDLGLTGRVALIGGGSRGLGLAAALALAREGVQLVITARNPEALETAAARVSAETGVQVIWVPADLAVASQARTVAEAALNRFGRVDILVNNAGGPPSGVFADFTDDDWLAAFRLNFMSGVTLSREVIPGMKARRWGRIVNLTSIAVRQPLDGLILSNAVRAGVHGLAKSLANELAPHGITVNNVLPGYILTDRVRDLARHVATRDGLVSEDVVARWRSAIPTGRLGQPEEIGDLVAFLASNRAAYITGTSIPMDGGFHKGLM